MPGSAVDVAKSTRGVIYHQLPVIDAETIARYEVVARCYASEYPAAPLALLTSDGGQVAGVHPCPACRDEPEFPAALGRESIR